MVERLLQQLSKSTSYVTFWLTFHKLSSLCLSSKCYKIFRSKNTYFFGNLGHVWEYMLVLTTAAIGKSIVVSFLVTEFASNSRFYSGIVVGGNLRAHNRQQFLKGSVSESESLMMHRTL